MDYLDCKNKEGQESGLMVHAKREVYLCGAQKDWPMYRDILAVFSSQGHSGGSASVVIPTLNKLLNWDNLSPLTSDPEQWVDHSEISSAPIWQSKRNPSVFSKDGGKTWYTLGSK